ncbi:MAG: MAPEG family protein [Gammaproteobacteria bacterium]|jgi:glutathione S-transferase
MDIVALIILLALAQYLFFVFRVGAGRVRYGVSAPKTTGDERWERLYRVQMNTLEQLIVFVPAMMLFASYVSAQWAWLPGVAFLAGRQLYAWEYTREPDSRGPGMGVTLLANGVLLVGGLIGVVLSVLG